MNKPLTVELVGDTQIKFTRRFDASPQEVWDAHWKPEILVQWLTGPDGWTMPLCKIADEVGAEIHMEWENSSGERFALKGVVKEIDAPRRSVHEETFQFPNATPSEVETTFHADGDGTMMHLLVTYTSKQAREDAINTGMAEGMEMSYARLDNRKTV